MLEDCERLRLLNDRLEDEKRSNLEKIREQERRLADFEGDRRDGSIGRQNVTTYNIGGASELKQQLAAKDKEIDKLQRHVNYIQDQIEEFMDENKLLRDMTKAPVNFGKNRENVRLLDREKIDDYKKLIRVLQDDNYALERERAKLKNMMRHMHMLQKCNNMDDITKQFRLSPDQRHRLDAFVIRLINNDTEEPSDFQEMRLKHEKLQAKYDALTRDGFEQIKHHMEDMLKKLAKDGGLGGGLNQDQLNQILMGYGDLNGKLEQLAKLVGEHNGGVPAPDMSAVLSQMQPMSGLAAMLQPPKPNKNFADGSINHGQSFKFDSQMLVTARGGADPEKGDPFENAFLQLQLQECFVLIEKKDEMLTAQKRDIDALYNKIKRYVLMQDHLYKDYVRMEK